MKPDFWDVLACASGLAIIYGTALIYAPAAWILGGLMGIGAAVAGVHARNGERRGDP
jgi:hypothetical protein